MVLLVTCFSFYQFSLNPTFLFTYILIKCFCFFSWDPRTNVHEKFYFPSEASYLMTADFFPGCGFLGIHLSIIQWFSIIIRIFLLIKSFSQLNFSQHCFQLKWNLLFKAQLISFIGLDFIWFGDNKYNPTVGSYTQVIGNCSSYNQSLCCTKGKI